MPTAVNDVTRLTIWQRLYSQRILSVFHLRTVTPPGPGVSLAAELLAICDHFKAPMTGLVFAMRQNVTSEVFFDEVRAQVVYPNRSIYMKQPIGATGLDVGTAGTANIAASIEKRTLRAGRRGIGRLQLAGIPQTAYADGDLNGGYLADLQLDFDPVLTGLISIPAVSGVYAHCLYGGNAVTSDDDIWAISPKQSVRTMHRRTVRVGI